MGSVLHRIALWECIGLLANTRLRKKLPQNSSPNNPTVQFDTIPTQSLPPFFPFFHLVLFFFLESLKTVSTLDIKCTPPIKTINLTLPNRLAFDRCSLGLFSSKRSSSLDSENNSSSSCFRIASMEN